MIVVNANANAQAEYKKSVEELLRIAQMSTGGSRVAAQVLLSAYNGDDFHLDVVDLGMLGRNEFGHALRVIWGRNIDPWMEPHKVIENGDTVFRRLWDDWRKLHVQNRWKRVCDECGGTGRVWSDEGMNDKNQCERCNGRGLLADIEWPGFDEQ